MTSYSEEPRRRSTDALLDEMRKDIKELLQSNASKQEILKNIEYQTVKTNGRVNELEKSHNKLDKKYEGMVNRVIGIASGISLCVSLLYKWVVR